MQEQRNEFKGYTLFNDIADNALRNRNRAVVMANIAEYNTKDKKISPKGASLIIGYMNEVPLHDRKNVMKEFSVHMKERGFIKEPAYAN